MDNQECNIKPINSDYLEELTGREVNDRIVSSAGFKCKKCFDVLRPPITLIKYLGNVCGMCTEGFDDALGVQNEMLELVLQNLILPCKYIKNGCGERLSYYEINNHKLICKYREFNCPLNVLTDCDWTQSLDFVKLHFRENHEDAILSETDSVFRLKIDISKNFEQIKILDNYNHLFILHLRYNIDDFKLQCTLHSIEQEKPFSKLEYMVRHESICRGTIVEDKNFNGNFNIDETLSIDLSQEHYENILAMDIYVEIITGATDTEILEDFECPVCKNYMKPPILQCSLGHSLCNSCNGKVQHCPSCRASLSNTRNYALESISNRFLFPCINFAQGCKVIGTGLEIIQHEEECSLLAYKCPNDCGWNGVYDELLVHIKTHYPDITKDSYYLKMLDINPSKQSLYMITYNRLFCASVRLNCNHTACLLVYLIGPKNEAKLFKYEFGLMNGVNKKVVFTNICQELGEGEPCQYFEVPKEIVSNYINNSQVMVYWKIIKQVELDHKGMLCK